MGQAAALPDDTGFEALHAIRRHARVCTRRRLSAWCVTHQ
jgi:hypothetical protein